MGVATRVVGTGGDCLRRRRSSVCSHRKRSWRWGRRLPQGWEIQAGRIRRRAIPRANPRPRFMWIPRAWFGTAAARRSFATCKGVAWPRGRTSAEGLPPDRWEAILEDREGNIWVRSEHQLAMRSPATRRFQLRTATGENALPPATNTLPALALDPEGNLLVPPISVWPGRRRPAGRLSARSKASPPTTFPLSNTTGKDPSGSACWDRGWRAGWATGSGRVGMSTTG